MMLVRGWVLAALAACGSVAAPAETPAASGEPHAGHVAGDPHAGHAAGDAHADHAAGDAHAGHAHHAEAKEASAAGARKTDDSLTGVIDQRAPPWQVSQWFNSPPLALEQLRGKVVLVRWFMGPSCPFCSATAPTLRALHERYASKGLAVVGMYHHKEQTPLDPKQVEGWIKHFGYGFPVAIDKDWTTLRRWWLDGHERSFTSVSFLIDKAGVVRRVHLGGTIAPEGDDIQAITADVERLLAQ